ncbi:MAG: clostripain-related cysteine peptidase, partial [Bacteroides sp.]
PSQPSASTPFTLLLSLCAGLLLSLASCIKESAEPSQAVERVLLVYLGGDNNLSHEVSEKLEALQAGFDGQPQHRILVYKDARGEQPTLLELQKQEPPTRLASYAEENSADAQVLQRVVQTALARYPQAQFNLLVFSHASGWLPEGSYADAAARSIIIDGLHEMELKDFAAALPDAAFESIVFEACHMAGIEVFYELRHKAKLIAASSAEIVSPGFTALYASGAVNQLVAGDTEGFMKQVFAHYQQESGVRQSATFSLIRTEALERLAAWLRTAADWTRPLDYSQIQKFDRYGQRFFFDWKDAFEQLLPQAEQELEELLQEVVVWKGATPYFMLGYSGFPIQSHSGLTTYLPQPDYSKLNAAYQALSWYQAIQP